MIVDTIANNLANLNTNGFKRTQVDFQDLIYVKPLEPGQEVSAGVTAPTGIEIGSGVRPASTLKVFTQGEPENTGRDLDLMIEGDGFFQLRLPDGSLAYTRDGSFKLDAERNIVTSTGYRMEPPLQVPADAIEIAIGRDGVVSVLLQGDTSNIQEIGQIEMARFPNAGGLKARGGNLYLESPGSGTPVSAFRNPR